MATTAAALETFSLRARLTQAVCRAVDAAAIRGLAAGMDRSPLPAANQHTREGLLSLLPLYADPRLLAEPGRFFQPPPPPRVRIERKSGSWGGELQLSFPSTYAPYAEDYAPEYRSYAANLTAHARWLRAERPIGTLVYLHGMAGGPFALEQRMIDAPRWLRAGLDVVMLQLPFHGLRRPAGSSVFTPLFPSPHLVRTNEAFGQAVHDLRALLSFLRAEGAVRVGLVGLSLGGYLAALLATLEPDLAFVGALCPAASVAHLMWAHGRSTAVRARAEKGGVTEELVEQLFALHSPLSRPALLPRERLCIVAGRDDLLTGPAQAQLLHRHWGGPALHWFAGGHLAQVGRRSGLDALEAFVLGACRS